jgi:hypothetical protein
VGVRPTTLALDNSVVDTRAGGEISQLLSQQLPAFAQLRHHSADRYSERLLDFLVREFPDLGQHHDLSVLLGQLSKGLYKFLVCKLFRDRFNINGCLLQFLQFTEDEPAEPFATLMRDHVKQNAEYTEHFYIRHCPENRSG